MFESRLKKVLKKEAVNKMKIGTVTTENGEKDVYYSMEEHKGIRPIILGKMGPGRACYISGEK